MIGGADTVIKFYKTDMLIYGAILQITSYDVISISILVVHVFKSFTCST